MNRLDAALFEAAPLPSPFTREDASKRLVAIALAYRRFSSENMQLWRNIFEHRLPPGSALPGWVVGKDVHLIRHIIEPLRVLMPEAPEAEHYLMARTLFSAVHGIISFGLEKWNVGVPADAQDAQIEKLSGLYARGFVEGISPLGAIDAYWRC